MKILLAYDNSKFADKAKVRAALLAKKLNAELTIISVVPDFSFSIGEISQEYYDAFYDATLKQIKQFLHDATESLKAEGIPVTSVLAKGDPAAKILETAESMDASIIILGSRGAHGVERFFLGSVSTKVAIHAKCDVFIVKES